MFQAPELIISYITFMVFMLLFVSAMALAAETHLQSRCHVPHTGLLLHVMLRSLDSYS